MLAPVFDPTYMHIDSVPEGKRATLFWTCIILGNYAIALALNMY